MSDTNMDKAATCGECGGAYRFDTTVPSDLWNRVIRSRGGSEYLCTACILKAFAEAGESFTATLWGDKFNGETVVVALQSTTVVEALREAWRSEAAAALVHALRLAKEATNGWACYAKREIEHRDISRLHREIDKLRSQTDTAGITSANTSRRDSRPYEIGPTQGPRG